jgi:hypothetical protein
MTERKREIKMSEEIELGNNHRKTEVNRRRKKRFNLSASGC